MSSRIEIAITDVHGRLDLLSRTLNAVYRRFIHQPIRFIFLGDYGDRGPHSRGVHDRLAAGSTRPQDEWIVLKGNHEDLAVRAALALRRCHERESVGRREHFGQCLDAWLETGGTETLSSYGWNGSATSLEDALSRLPADWFHELPLSYETTHRIYVHAGLFPDRQLSLQRERDLLWIRERFLAAPAGRFEKHVVHGHTPEWERKRPDQPELLPHRTNLDTAAYATGILTAGVFEPARPGGATALIQAVEARGVITVRHQLLAA